MGANHQGEINALCQIALPDYGIITNIGKAHLEGFGGEEGVLKGKTELYRHLKTNHKKIILNIDDAKLVDASNGIESFTYGQSNAANVIGRLINNSDQLNFEFKSNGNWHKVQTKLTGGYNFYNALVAVTAGILLEINDNDIINGLENYLPNNNRSQIEKKGNNTLILDAYNANPSSMKLAIENAAALPYSNKLFLLGDMREMGTYAAQEHKSILDQLKNINAKIVLIGSEFFVQKNNYDFYFFENTEKAIEWLQNNKPENSLILLKGSRGIQLESLLSYL
jgi:UDP-N-acetylmuramoyl-tripeptide--D-alanyl-D-alanine ligase